MDHIVKDGAGREDFVRYWRLMAEVGVRWPLRLTPSSSPSLGNQAVRDHPSAFAAELMNGS